ncbi:MAG: hypothetical protein R3B64_02285 [Candidatus Paceibacterota bacterium]
MKNQKKKDWWYRKIGGIHQMLLALCKKYGYSLRNDHSLDREYVRCYKMTSSEEVTVQLRFIRLNKCVSGHDDIERMMSNVLEMYIVENSSIEKIEEIILQRFSHRTIGLEREKRVINIIKKNYRVEFDQNGSDDLYKGVDLYVYKDDLKIPIQIKYNNSPAEYSRQTRSYPQVSCINVGPNTPKEAIIRAVWDIVNDRKRGYVLSRNLVQLMQT